MLTFFKTKKKVVFSEKTLDRIKTGKFMLILRNRHVEKC